MKLAQAIKLLSPYHQAKVIWIVPTDHSQGITGQLTTGLVDHPLIAVHNSMVCADDLYTILEEHAKHQIIPMMLSMPTQHLLCA
jgi:hypothetical protein